MSVMPSRPWRQMQAEGPPERDPRETGPLVKTVDAVRAVLEETETTVRFLPCK